MVIRDPGLTLSRRSRKSTASMPARMGVRSYQEKIEFTDDAPAACARTRSLKRQSAGVASVTGKKANSSPKQQTAHDHASAAKPS